MHLPGISVQYIRQEFGYKKKGDKQYEAEFQLSELGT